MGRGGLGSREEGNRGERRMGKGGEKGEVGVAPWLLEDRGPWFWRSAGKYRSLEHVPRGTASSACSVIFQQLEIVRF